MKDGWCSYSCSYDYSNVKHTPWAFVQAKVIDTQTNHGSTPPMYLFILIFYSIPSLHVLSNDMLRHSNLKQNV